MNFKTYTDIHKNDLEGIPFNVPCAIEEYLIEAGYYESSLVMMGSVYYNAPVVHYIDWLEQKGLLK